MCVESVRRIVLSWPDVNMAVNPEHAPDDVP